jgi:molecular chaperone GrpE
MNEPKDNDSVIRGAFGAEPDNTQNPAESADIVREAAQIAALHVEIADLKDRYVRAVAEVENIRKRAEREKQDATQFAFARFAKDLLSVADNFERALEIMKPEKRATLPAEAQSVFEGIEATQRQMFSVFERFGIKRIEAMGQKFNPNLHDAIAEIPSTQHPPGSVYAVAEHGYVIGERLLRAAKVAITAQSPQAQASGGPATPPGSTIDTNA